MDPEEAIGLVKQGATLLLLDVPQYTLIGIDTQMFTVGPAFKGIKMIPPGPHFLFYCSSHREWNDFSPIIGFFVDARPSQVIVRKWDSDEERLVKLSEDEEERYSQAVKNLEFDKHLGAYTLSQYGDWKRLSNYITKDVIERIEPIGGEITVVNESDGNGNVPKTSKEKALAEQLKDSDFSKQVENLPRKGCYYTLIPRIIKQKGIKGHQLTCMNLDKTQLLESILMRDYGGSEDLILGEIQFAYIAFVMGQSLEGFFQWKSLVSLFLGCTEAPLHTRSKLFTKFIGVIYHQLKYGFQKERNDSNSSNKGALVLLDETWLSTDSFLHHLCKDFFSLVLEATMVDGDLLFWARKMKEMLEDSFGWDFQQRTLTEGVHFDDDDELHDHFLVAKSQTMISLGKENQEMRISETHGKNKTMLMMTRMASGQEVKMKVIRNRREIDSKNRSRKSNNKLKIIRTSSMAMTVMSYIVFGLMMTRKKLCGPVTKGTMMMIFPQKLTQTKKATNISINYLNLRRNLNIEPYLKFGRMRMNRRSFPLESKRGN